MSHTVTSKLNRAANIHKSDKGTVFFITLGEKNYDSLNKCDAWTNYEAAIFAKQDGQIAHYKKVLVAGAIVSVTSSGLIDREDTSGNNYPTKKEMVNPRVDFALSNDLPAPPAMSDAPVPDSAIPF